MPAQALLPQLGVDSRIQQGTLGCGASYYMVTDPVKKGYAQVALVQKADALTPAKRQGLSPAFLSRMGVAPGPEGYLSEKDGSTIYQFNDVRFYVPEVLDSVLLYTFGRMAASRAPQAVIVSGDIDAVELKKKMDIFSMLVSRLPQPQLADTYEWTSQPAPKVTLTTEGPAIVKAGYSGARVPSAYMNTAQAIVTDLFSQEFRLLLEHRLKKNLQAAGIPYGSIDFSALRSVDTSDDEHYAVQVSVAPEHLEDAMAVLAGTLGELDEFGPGVQEFTECKQVLLPSMQRRASAIPSAGDYVDRCVAHFLFGAQLAPSSEPLRFFARKRVADSTETRFFSDYASALLTQLENLSLTYGPMAEPDSTGEAPGDVLFRYNLHYLLGSLSPSGTDYNWHAADTAGLEFSFPRVRIKSEKTAAVSGGTLWTFTNGLRVVYKQVKGSGRFSYALQLNGGLSQIGNLKEGEGGYIGDLLLLDDAAGLPAPVFRDMLLANGITMNSSVQLNSMAITGDAPADKLSLVLKALLSVANLRGANPAEFSYFQQCQRLRGADDALLQNLTPGYKYTTLRKPSALTADTQKKAWKYFDDRFARVNDGVLILSGDLPAEVTKRLLMHYLGGFRVMRNTASRKSVDLRMLSGTKAVSASQPGVRVVMDAEYPVTIQHFYVSKVALEALRLSLVRHLADDGFVPEVRLSCFVHPRERFQMDITCTPIPEAHLPAEVEEVASARAITAVRAAIRDAAAHMEAADLKAWKTMVQADVVAALEQPDAFTASLLARYAENKDMLTGYKEAIADITADQVKEFLTVLSGGGCIESIYNE